MGFSRNKNVREIFSSPSYYSSILSFGTPIVNGASEWHGQSSKAPAVVRGVTSGIDTLRSFYDVIQGIRGRNPLSGVAGTPSGDGGVPASPSTTETPSSDSGVPATPSTAETPRHGRGYYAYKKIALPTLGFLTNALTSISSGLSIGGLGTASKWTGLGSAIVGGAGGVVEGGRHIQKIFNSDNEYNKSQVKENNSIKQDETKSNYRMRQFGKTIADGSGVIANALYGVGAFLPSSLIANIFGDALSLISTGIAHASKRGLRASTGASEQPRNVAN